jgi:hypothetical protein
MPRKKKRPATVKARSGYVATKVALAVALDIARTELYRDFRQPGHPGKTKQGYSVEKWKQFRQTARPAATSSKQNAEIEYKRAQTRNLDFDFAVKRKDYLPCKDVNETIASANAIVTREFLKLEYELPPHLEGLAVEEIRVELGRAIREVLKNLPKKFKGTEPEKGK